MHVVHPPVLVRNAIHKALAVSRPNNARKGPGNDVRQLLTRLQIPNMNRKSLRSIVVISISHQPPVRTHRQLMELQVVLALRQSILIQNQTVRTPTHRTPIVPPILRARVKLLPINPSPVLLRNTAFIFLHPTLHLLKHRLHQVLLRSHLRLKIRVLSLQIRQHIRVIDFRIIIILQPIPGILQRDAMILGVMGAFLGDRGQGGHEGRAFDRDQRSKNHHPLGNQNKRRIHGVVSPSRSKQPIQSEVDRHNPSKPKNGNGKG